MKSVVVIVVNYNSGPWLERCVSSVLSSDYPLQLYIVDNASSDQSVDKCRSLLGQFENFHLIENQTNLGFAKANNLVLNTTKADYYVLINPDCMVEKETIGYLVGMMQQDHQVGLAGASISNEDGSPQKTSKRKFPTPENSFVRVLGLGRWFAGDSKFSDFDIGQASSTQGKEYVEAISGAFMVVSAEALNQVGGLDEGYFMHCEDLDWCKRVWLHGFKVAYYSAANVVHGKGKSSQSSPYRVNWYLHKGMLRFYRKFYRSHYSKIVSVLVYLGVSVRFCLTNVRIFLRRLFLKRSTSHK